MKTNTTFTVAVMMTIAALTSCATSPEELAKQKMEAESIVAQTWYRPSSPANHQGHSLESDAVCKLASDGSGKLISRRFGYTKPGVKVGPAMGTGAYTEVITWPVSWEIGKRGRLYIEGTEDPTTTGRGYINRRPLDACYAERNGNQLVLHYSHSTETYESVDPKDPRLNPSTSETKNRLASWAEKGPGLIAQTDANVANAQQHEPPMTLMNMPTISPGPYMTPSNVSPPAVRYWAPGGNAAINAALMNNLGR